MKLSVVGRPSCIGKTPIIGRVTRATQQPVEPGLRRDTVLLVDSLDTFDGLGLPGVEDIAGHAAIICSSSIRQADGPTASMPMVSDVDTSHLASGDVVSIAPTGYIRTLYRMGSRHNVVFATDACNSYCLMCSQPPRPVDPKALLAEHLRLLSLISDVPPELGITGGEPTLLKDGLLEIVAACKERFPNTPVHMLSNGRLFYYGAFARRLADVGHPDLMIGVPVYSDVDVDHDHIVQARGAFDQTLVGLQNLGRYGVPVEIRIVIHRLTFQRLTAVAAFIYRNLTFAAHVTFMGLEPTGFAVPNLDHVWIDPSDYRDELESAVLFLAARGMNVSVYNHQLCTVSPAIREFCRQSISDWKNEYLPVCTGCAIRERCGGFFSSSLRHRYSRHITPVPADERHSAEAGVLEEVAGRVAGDGAEVADEVGLIVVAGVEGEGGQRWTLT
jgi:His-Xaa-Ser system radical SAM maturase HxsC